MLNNIVFWGAGNHGRLALQDFDNSKSETERLKGFYDSNKNAKLKNYAILIFAKKSRSIRPSRAT